MDDLIAELGLPPRPETLPTSTVDAHTHLDTTTEYTGLAPDDALALAASVGVNRVVTVGCDVESSRFAVNCATTHRQVAAAIAIHPNDIARMSPADHEAAWEVIDELAADPAVRAVGETGLDYFRTKDPALQGVQHESFRRHIAIAKAHDRTLMIHDRDAHDDIADILDEVGWCERTIFHCYSADEPYARRVLAHETWLSFAGNITYKANQPMRDALAITPLDRILVETDAPFLTPVPLRGKKNASYLIPHTIRFIAEFRGVELADLCHQLRANAEQALGGSWGITEGGR
ncbi:TatD family hydrolase [Propionibacterium sp. oral taxon 192 str. F0372]|uniref:TatD family hydrolase n=1 Tax=Propionibacterium sp. oral taxon 192 TaxID=671222 RepID=UPI000352C8D9|nr:TatD family hydrolase [Propionibacterium sp. oral taxon 192]EPH03465.1 TatD family hydrolase [Propionibacterium sp. oral taxon 192 str. F0372]